jgi:hypothetical protein
MQTVFHHFCLGTGQSLHVYLKVLLWDHFTKDYNQSTFFLYDQKIAASIDRCLLEDSLCCQKSKVNPQNCCLLRLDCTQLDSLSDICVQNQRLTINFIFITEWKWKSRTSSLCRNQTGLHAGNLITKNKLVS